MRRQRRNLPLSAFPHQVTPSMINPVLERIRLGTVLCDGAMGTALYARGIPYQRCFDELCLSEPGSCNVFTVSTFWRALK